MCIIAGLRSLTQNKVIKILEGNGFRKVRTGKHITFKKTELSGDIKTTWVPMHRTVSVFVIKYIIKQTGKPREEFY
ncbi:type II toxin-antitoxin system HicA family toxin [Candidatus Micrarchaeota archaeon]|nr:type II toxin-antitoxin system HicA family toxin [Candidatus Micrarchaeota archaeon]MBU2476274.1 type II toxin-antitoxin system HicA family toxin [Candidatus Micrarchaeota archaeon]